MNIENGYHRYRETYIKWPLKIFSIWYVTQGYLGDITIMNWYYYHFHIFRRFRKILQSPLLFIVYKSHVQSKQTMDCLFRVILRELVLTVCSEFRIYLSWWHVITHHIRSHGIDLARSLKLQTMRDKDYITCYVFKCLNVPMTLLSFSLRNDVTIHVGLHGHDTRNDDNINSYVLLCSKEIYKRSFLYEDS